MDEGARLRHAVRGGDGKLCILLCLYRKFMYLWILEGRVRPGRSCLGVFFACVDTASNPGYYVMITAHVFSWVCGSCCGCVCVMKRVRCSFD